MQDLSLEKFGAVLTAFEAATTAQEIKEVIGMAKAAEIYARQTKLGNDLVLKAAEYVIRAERKLGEKLVEAKAAGQISRGNKSGDNQYKSGNVPNENNSTFTLEEAGIDRKLSSKAQKIAAVSKEEFEARLLAARAAGKINFNAVVKPAPPTNGAKPARKPRVTHTKEPNVTRDDLSFSAQQRFDAAIRKYKDQLRAEFFVAVNQRIAEYLEDLSPKLKKEQQVARMIMERRKGIMSRKTYRKILACLHPDRGLHPDRETDPGLKQTYEEAFRLFTTLEKQILDEKESPTGLAHIPSTMAEWEALRRKGKEQKTKSDTQHGIARR